MQDIQKRSYMIGLTTLYWVSAILGLWVSYNASEARFRFILLSMGSAVVIVSGILNRQQRQLAALVAASTTTILTAAIASYYLFRQQFHHDTLSGVTGSVLAILLPLAIGTLIGSATTKRWLWFVLSALSTLLSMSALAMTRERTAWLSLAAGLLVAGIFWLSQKNDKTAKQLPILSKLIWLFALAGVIFYIAFLRLDSFSQWLVQTVHLNTDGDLFGRRELWNNGLALIADYPFTGSGLAATGMSLATYVYINYVTSQPHLHNLYLQVGAEQGLLGLFTLSGVILLAVAISMEALQSGKNELQWLRLASLASAITLAVYGLFDAEIYAYVTVPLAFVPLAFSLLIRKSPRIRPASRRGISATDALPEAPQFSQIALSTVMIALLVVLIWINGNTLRSALFTNLGTVAQTQAELGVYQWPAWGIQDQLRQTEGGVDLSQTERFLRVGLVFNPQNETSLRRLGQIALARGEFTKAEELLRAAEQIAPNHQATRQMLGELLAIRGQTDEATKLWQSVPFLDGQLDGRIWWYEQQHNQQAVDNIRRVMTQLN